MKQKTINISYQSSLRATFLITLFEWSKPIYRVIFKRKKEKWRKSKSDLAAMHPQSLGYHLFIFLQNHGFELEPKLENHDVAHLLYDIDTDVVSEVCLQFFFLGNGKRSLYCIGSAFLGLFVLPEHIKSFRSAFHRGSLAKPSYQWEYEHLLNENINELKQFIFNQNHNA